MTTRVTESARRETLIKSEEKERLLAVPLSLHLSWLITTFILLHEKFLQFDWLRAVVFQLNLKYLHVKITNLLYVVV